MNDEELLTRYLETKDHELFTILHQRMHNELLALAIEMLHSREDAEDVVQATWLKLHGSKAHRISSAKGFLKTAVKRLSLDHQRDNQSGVRRGIVSFETFEKTKWIEDDSEYQDIPPKYHDVADPKGVPIEAQAYTNELWDRAEEALQGLSPIQREAVELYYCRGLEVSEIAEIVGAKEGTIRSRIRRGTGNLHDILVPDTPVKYRSHQRAVRATDPRTGALVCAYPSVAGAVQAGYKSCDSLYRALRRGTVYKGLNWSYANAT